MEYEKESQAIEKTSMEIGKNIDLICEGGSGEAAPPKAAHGFKLALQNSFEMGIHQCLARGPH